MNINKNFLNIAKYLLQIEIKAYKESRKNKIEVKDKGPHDLITNFDTTIEKFIIKQLFKRFPTTKIVSEEYNNKVIAEGTYFTIDPVDGTVNFANGLDTMWGVQISYVENDENVACAIYLPYTEKYFAAKGFGAYKNGKRFFVEEKPPEYSLICIDTKEIEMYQKLAMDLDKKILKFRHFGATCIHSAVMAEGNIGGFIQFDGYPWDLLPGFLLMEEAGCKRKTLHGVHIFASNEKTLKILTESIKNNASEKMKTTKCKTKATLPEKDKEE